MSRVTLSPSGHITLGEIRHRYGLRALSSFVDSITITSLADILDDITPGALFISSSPRFDPQLVHAAAMRGAYGIVFLPSAMHDDNRGKGGREGSVDDGGEVAQTSYASAVTSTVENAEIPIFFADLTNDMRGRLAADLADHPADSVAVFALQGKYAADISRELAQILHLLGNPLGVIDRTGAYSAERPMGVNPPFSPFDIQHVLAVMLEDGASCVVMTVDSDIVERDALSTVSIDIYNTSDQRVFTVPEVTAPIHQRGKDAKNSQLSSGIVHKRPQNSSQSAESLSFMPRKNSKIIPTRDRASSELQRRARVSLRPFGADLAPQTLCVEVTDAAYEVARDVVDSTVENYDGELYCVATAIAMVMAAGIKRSSIKSALRLSRELRGVDLVGVRVNTDDVSSNDRGSHDATSDNGSAGDEVYDVQTQESVTDATNVTSAISDTDLESREEA